MTVITKVWNNQAISFTQGDTIIGSYNIPNEYINATEMCKANGKEWSYYKRLPSTKEYLDVLCADLQASQCGLIISIIGGDNKNVQGTWVHPEIAIDLASWISVKFRIWVNRTIKELMNGASIQEQINVVEQQEHITTGTLDKELLNSYIKMWERAIRTNDKRMISIARGNMIEISERLFPGCSEYAEPTKTESKSVSGAIKEFIESKLEITNDVSDKVSRKELYDIFGSKLIPTPNFSRQLKTELLNYGWEGTHKDLRINMRVVKGFTGLKFK